MCGVFGFVGDTALPKDGFSILVRHSQQRGWDSSGVMFLGDSGYEMFRAALRDHQAAQSRWRHRLAGVTPYRH